MSNEPLVEDCPWQLMQQKKTTKQQSNLPQQPQQAPIKQTTFPATPEIPRVIPQVLPKACN